MTDQGLQDTEYTPQSVLDGDRLLEFTGIRLGASSSHQPGKERWAEIYIFRTEAGRYIVSGIGRTKIAGERDKLWAQVCDDPSAVIERLHLSDDRRGRYLPYVSREAIDQARHVDPAFENAYLVEHVD